MGPAVPMLVKRYLKRAWQLPSVTSGGVFAEFLWPPPTLRRWQPRLPVRIFSSSIFRSCSWFLLALQSLLSQALGKGWHVYEAQVLRGPRKHLLGFPGSFPEDAETGEGAVS